MASNLDLALLDLLKDHRFLKSYIVTPTTRSGRRTTLRRYAKSDRSIRGVPISFSTEEIDQLRQFLDEHLKLDEAENKLTSPGTIVRDIPYCANFLECERKEEIAKALNSAGEYLKKVVVDWYYMSQTNFAQIQSAWLKQYAMDNTTASKMVPKAPNRPVTLEDLEDEDDDMACGIYHNTTMQTQIASNKEPEMSLLKTENSIKVEKQTLLNGTKIESYSDESLYNIIAAAEAKVAELEKIQNKPKRLVKEIESRRADIQTLVDYLDSKED